MSRRTLAALVAVGCLVVLLGAAAFMPVPYVTFGPGVSVDVLAEDHGKEIVQVSGHRTYRDDGELRMTTIFLSGPETRVTVFDALKAWISPDDAVYPYDVIYGEHETAEQSNRESAVDMVQSQDAATAVALHALGYKFPKVTEVLNVQTGMPADGKLQVRDIFVKANGARVKSPDDVVKAIEGTTLGKAVTFVVRRNGKLVTLSIKPVTVHDDEGDHMRTGVTAGPGYLFPFSVRVNIPELIGGPSAGLMFSLAIYDTLTPGSLTGGTIIAGTGTIDPTGKVGPIGGIQQKIVTARNAHAELFLVPADNCADALTVSDPGVRLVKVTTMASARSSIEAWVENPNADLPACEKG